MSAAGNLPSVPVRFKSKSDSRLQSFNEITEPSLGTSKNICSFAVLALVNDFGSQRLYLLLKIGPSKIQFQIV